MTEIKNKLGTFTIERNLSNKEIEKIKLSDKLKCLDKSGKTVTLFGNNIISNSNFNII